MNYRTNLKHSFSMARLNTLAGSATVLIATINGASAALTPNAIAARDLAISHAMHTVSNPIAKRQSDEEAERGFLKTCFPNAYDRAKIRSWGIKASDNPDEVTAKMGEGLRTSNFPCEQLIYIPHACGARAHSQIDYEAEQMCFCGSTFWQANIDCEACLVTHGVTAINGRAPPSPEDLASTVTSVSASYCSQTLVPSGGVEGAGVIMNLGNAVAAADPAASVDFVTGTGELKFAGQTAIGNYATEVEVGLGLVTGSATARETVLTINTEGASSGQDMDEEDPEGAAAGLAAPMMAVMAGLVLGAGLVL